MHICLIIWLVLIPSDSDSVVDIAAISNVGVEEGGGTVVDTVPSANSSYRTLY